MRKKSRQLNQIKAEINVVPYIDVMLVLLVIFMVTAPLLQQGVAVDLPEASSNPLPSQDKEPIVVSISKNGQYYLNVAQNPNQAIDGQDLALRVKAQLTQYPNRKVLVKGDQNAVYGQIIGAMVLLQQSGVNNVGLITANTQDDTLTG